MLNKLRNRFLIMCMAITLLVLFVAFIAVYMTMGESIKSENQSKLENAVLSARQNVTSGIALSPPDRNPVGSTNLPIFTLVVDEVGTVIERKTNLEISDYIYDEALDFALANQSGAEVKIADKIWIYDISDIPVYELINGQGAKFIANNTQIIFLDITDSHNVLDSLLVTLAVVGVVTTGFVFLFSLFLANRSIKPVRQAWDKQRQFVADASHELKTPLSVIKSNYDAILDDKTETVESQLEWFGYMKSGMDRMEKLIYALLSLARIEDTKNNVVKEPFDIGKAIQSTIEPFAKRISEKSIILSCTIPKGITIHNNKVMIVNVFEILLDNAVKYTEINGNIQIELRRERRNIIFTVGNSGKDIPKSELSKIFDRFYRADTSRSSDMNSHGLGLAIAKETVERIGGEINAESHNGWTLFTVRIN